MHNCELRQAAFFSGGGSRSAQSGRRFVAKYETITKIRTDDP